MLDDKGAFGGDVGFKLDGSGDRATRRKMLEREVDRHETKLTIARTRLAAIAGIPDKDPFTDGTVLAFERKVGNRTYTYAAIRQNGTWWTTEATGKGPRNWVSLTDWMVDGGTTQVVQMQPDEAIDLASMNKPSNWPICACPPEALDPHGPDPFHEIASGGTRVHRVCPDEFCQRDLAIFSANTAVSSDHRGGVDLFCRCSRRIGWSAAGGLSRVRCGLANHDPHYTWTSFRGAFFPDGVLVPAWCIGLEGERRT